MGWVALAIVAVVTGAALWLLGVPRTLASIAGAAIMLGATGYAWQGRPTLPATPVEADANPFEVAPGMVAFRTMVLRPRNAAAFAASDAALRQGDAGAAVRTMLAAIQADPGDVAAWTGLGYLYAVHDAGQLSPAANFAFARAIRLDPQAPGPPFFLGLSQFTAGDFGQARAAWSSALALTPKDAPYRADIEMRLGAAQQMVNYRRALDAVDRAPRDAAAPAR